MLVTQFSKRCRPANTNHPVDLAIPQVPAITPREDV
jgi:hypothetical protein